MAKYRLREGAFRSGDEERQHYGRTYPDGYRHDRWPDHVERIGATVDMLAETPVTFESAADLSCGDAAILRSLAGRRQELREVWLGDLLGVRPDGGAWPEGTAVHALPPAPLLDSLYDLPVDDGVDLFVLSETLEHMPDPEHVLNEISQWSSYLFLSTPVSEPVGSGNMEHYWGWSAPDISDMLRGHGWIPLEMRLLRPESTRHYADAYTFQLWTARSVNS